MLFFIFPFKLKLDLWEFQKQKLVMLSSFNKKRTTARLLVSLRTTFLHRGIERKEEKKQEQSYTVSLWYKRNF